MAVRNYTTMAENSYTTTADSNYTTMAGSNYTTMADSNYTTMVDNNFTTMANRNITISSADTEGKHDGVSTVLITGTLSLHVLLCVGLVVIICRRNRFTDKGKRTTKELGVKGNSLSDSEPLRVTSNRGFTDIGECTTNENESSFMNTDLDVCEYTTDEIKDERAKLNLRLTGEGKRTTKKFKDKSLITDEDIEIGKTIKPSDNQTTISHSVDLELMLQAGTSSYIETHPVPRANLKIQSVSPFSKPRKSTDFDESPPLSRVERLTSNEINDVDITRSLQSTSSVAFSNVEGQSSTSRNILREIKNNNDVTFHHESYKRTLSDGVVSNAASTSSPDQPTEAGYHENFALETNSEVSGHEVDINNGLGNSEASEKQIVASIKSESDECYEHLDWNKLFLFVAQIISPKMWKLFFVQLFGHIKHDRVMDINSIIEHKELEQRGGLSTLFYELMVEWHKFMGAKACPTMIQSSLEGIGDTLSQEKFNNFIRDPPKIPSNPRPWHNNENVPLPTTCAPIMALYRTDSDFESNGGIAICRSKREELYFHKSTTLPSIFTNSQGFGSVGTRSFHESQKYRKRDISGMDTSSEDEKMPCKFQKLTNQHNSGGVEKQNKRVNNTTVKRKRTNTKKRIRYSNFPTKCGELVKWETVDHNYMIQPIKSLMQTDSVAIGEKEYNLYLHHTVNTLMEGTGETEEIILTLHLENYENKHSHKAKSGHLTVLMETDSTTLCLKENECECLEFYVEKPRTRIVQHQLQRDAKFKDSAFVFIDYFGNPLLGKESSVGDQTKNEARVVNEIRTQTEMVENENNEENQPTYGNRDKESCANTNSTHDEVRNDDMTTEACATGNTNTDCVIDETHLGNNVHENEDVEDKKDSGDEENVNKCVAGYNNMQNEDNGDKIIEHKGSSQVNDESVEKVEKYHGNSDDAGHTWQLWEW